MGHREKKLQHEEPFLSSGENTLGMGILFPPHIFRALDCTRHIKAETHRIPGGHTVLAIPSCVPCKAGQAWRGKVGSGRGPWEDGLWRGMGGGMGGTPGTLGKTGSQLPRVQNELV